MQSQQTLLLSSISTQVANQAQWFQSTQLEQIRSLNTIASLPSSADAFEFSRAIRNRRRTAALMNPTEISKFRKWHSSKDVFPVLIAQGRGLMTSARDFAVDYVEILRSNKAPVIWLLPHTSIISEKPVSLNDTLLMLVIQLIQLNPRVLAEGSFPILPCHFQDAVPDEHNLEERSWRLLERCLEGMETLYIVVDLSFVHIVVNNNYARAATFLRRLQSILTARTGGGLKLVLASWISGRGLESNELDSLQRPQIFVDGPISRLSKRRVNRSNHLLVTGRAALRKRLVSL
jgi:hypothetical protein